MTNCPTFPIIREISNQERRARLGQSHLLAQPGSNVVSVASSVIGLHSSDPATVYLSVWARLPGFEVLDLEQALYEDRSLIRILGMRRTMFVVPAGLGPTVHCSSTISMIEAQQKRVANILESSGITNNGTSWLASVSKRTMNALESRGEATAAELTKDVPELGQKITAHKNDGTVIGTFGVSTRILFLLALEGRIIRARPKGSWVSSLYSWTPMERWTGQTLDGMDRQLAQQDLLRVWLESFGPATEVDIKWWTGWPVRQVREALSVIGAIEVAVEAGPAYVSDSDIDRIDSSNSWVAFLPSLDPTVMGWKERHWYLGDHAARLFDRNGNAGPTVWADGKVVGGWAQRRDGEVLYRLLEDVDRDVAGSIDKRAHDLQTWLGGTVVTPRFRSPLDKELATS